MSDKTFHVESSGNLHAGDIIRVSLRDMGSVTNPFIDEVILGFNEDGDARVARPYAYATSVGTTGPTQLIGCEVFTIYADQLRHWTKIAEGWRMRG